MSDESGKRKAGRARSIAYKYETNPAKGSVLSPAFVDHLLERPLDFGKRRVESGAAGIDHDIPLRADFGAVEAESLAETALNAVANHGSTNGAGYGETQARAGSRGPRVRQAKGGEQGTGKANTVVISGSEFDGAQDPRRGRKRECAAGCGFSWTPWQSGRLSRR